MGGYGSGRSSGRPTTENGLTLTLSKLLRDGLFRPECTRSGSLVWTNTTTGERVGSISYEAHRPGIRARTAALHHDPVGCGAARVRLLDQARDDASTLRRPTMVVHMPTDRATGRETLLAQWCLHLRGAPSVPARIPLPTRTRP